MSANYFCQDHYSPYGEEERYIDPMALDDDIQPDVFFHDPSPAPRHEVASIMDLELNFSDPTVTESYESSAWSMAPNAHDVRYREGQRYSPNDVLTFQGGTAGQSCKPELRLTGSALQRSQIGDIPAFAPVKGEREPIGEVQPHECSQCRSNFPSLQLLDQHAKIESHKAWKCYEEGCGKAYARRDTFMRHQLKHGGSGHACGTCKRGGKDKVFKRKDHLAEHVRKCHGPGNDTSSIPNGSYYRRARTVNDAVADGWSGNAFTAECTQYSHQEPQKHEAMQIIIRSLGTVLGEDHQTLRGLENKVTALSGLSMESVAESMAANMAEVTTLRMTS